MKYLKIHQNGVGGRGVQGGGVFRGEGKLGQTLIKDKPIKVQLVVFLSKTGTYHSLI